MLDANAPSSVSFDGTVVTPNEITSPLTGKRAAALRVTLLARRVSPGPRDGETAGVDLGGGGGPDVFTRIGDVWYGTSIVVADADGREVLVATSGLGLRAATADRGAAPLGTQVPPELAPLLGAAAAGLVCYREALVLEGARVRLRATVFPIGPRRWETRSDFGPVVLHEIAPPPGSKARIS
jgi:hypothetical protein